MAKISNKCQNLYKRRTQAPTEVLRIAKQKASE